MRTIALHSQKGGTGKTTLTAHLAVQAEQAGAGPVFVIDTDPQASLTAWHSRRQADTPTLVDAPLKHIEQALQVLREQHPKNGACFIDTAPSRTDENRALLRLVDLVVVPARASPTDLWANAATVELLKADNIPFAFLVNQVKHKSSMGRDAAAALAEHGPVLPAGLMDRVLYAAALTDGHTAPELDPHGPAAKEVAALCGAILIMTMKS